MSHENEFPIENQPNTGSGLDIEDPFEKRACELYIALGLKEATGIIFQETGVYLGDNLIRIAKKYNIPHSGSKADRLSRKYGDDLEAEIEQSPRKEFARREGVSENTVYRILRRLRGGSE